MRCQDCKTLMVWLPKWKYWKCIKCKGVEKMSRSGQRSVYQCSCGKKLTSFPTRSRHRKMNHDLNFIGTEDKIKPFEERMGIKRVTKLLQKKPKRPCVCGHGAGWHNHSATKKLMEVFPHYNYGCKFKNCLCIRFDNKKE